MASSRTLLATFCLLFLLMVLGGALAEARTGLQPPRRNRKLASEHVQDVQLGVGAKGENDEPPKNATNVISGWIQLYVGSFGAAGDGQTDDTAAFQDAWATACSSARPAVVVVPAGKTYLLKETHLSGPCQSKVTLKLDGALVAPEDKSGWGGKNGHPRWVSFRGVDGLTVTGEGSMDGRGETSWKNSCRLNHEMPCTFAPAALTFTSCNRLRVEGIKLLNAPQIHLWVEYSRDVKLSRLTIDSPGDSPENDGIHVSHSDGVRIAGVRIGAGDDCLSVGAGTSNLHAAGVDCGPGHGISVGSLGKGNTRAEVWNVTVEGARVSGTMFGARIKTWQGGAGYARGIRFLDMVMDGVRNPILIDQNYCTTADASRPPACAPQEGAVQVDGVVFSNIRGTTVTKDAIRLHCSRAFPCRDVVLRDVQLKMKRGGGGDKNSAGMTTSSCENVILGETTNVSPAPCLPTFR